MALDGVPPRRRRDAERIPALGRDDDQAYLRTTMVPALEYRLHGDTLEYRWADVVPGFDMPVKATIVWPELAWLHPMTSWQRTRVKVPNPSDFRLDPNFYVIARRLDAPT